MTLRSVDQAALDYEQVRTYWSEASPSTRGTYMMDGFGFPQSAGLFRFRKECQLVEQTVRDVETRNLALDVGSGVGIWAEYLAERFQRVVAVERSHRLHRELVKRCSSLSNVTVLREDVMAYQQVQRVDLVFCGGLLMYLNQEDALTLLQRLGGCLAPGGVMICRESTVQHGIQIRSGAYQAIYRSVAAYKRLAVEAGLEVVHVEMNQAYFFIEVVCDLMGILKARRPESSWALPLVGRALYLSLRCSYPWGPLALSKLLVASGRQIPALTNHFFILRSPQDKTRRSARGHDNS